MHEVKCPVCDHKMEVADSTKHGDRITCPNCFAQLVFDTTNGKMSARCAMCEQNKVECSEDCEKRLSEREKRGFFDIKL